jgi:hypothetical protein
MLLEVTPMAQVRLVIQTPSRERIVIRVPRRLALAVRRKARELGVSSGQVVREALIGRVWLEGLDRDA